MTPRLIAISTALTLIAGAACAEDADFALLDSDSSGGLSLAELQVIDINATAAGLAAYDTDGSGELSAEEYSVWFAARVTAE